MVLFILTSLPSPDYIPTFELGDKFEHFFAYCGLSVLLFFALNFQGKYTKLRAKSVNFTIIICSFYGLFDELHQIPIPGRTFDLLDLLANVIGITLGVTIGYLFFKYLLKQGDENISKTGTSLH